MKFSLFFRWAPRGNLKPSTIEWTLSSQTLLYGVPALASLPVPVTRQTLLPAVCAVGALTTPCTTYAVASCDSCTSRHQLVTLSCFSRAVSGSRRTSCPSRSVRMWRAPLPHRPQATGRERAIGTRTSGKRRRSDARAASSTLGAFKSNAHCSTESLQFRRVCVNKNTFIYIINLH